MKIKTCGLVGFFLEFRLMPLLSLLQEESLDPVLFSLTLSMTWGMRSSHWPLGLSGNNLQS